jgi:hypothetical protein
VEEVLLSKNQTIAGVPATTARATVIELYHQEHSTKGVAQRLGMKEAEAGHLLAQLEADGYITRHERFWRNTVAGNALAKAKIGILMPRAKAEAHLAALLERVREVNADPDGILWVDVVELYGSLADSDRQAVGDVDLRLTVTRRHDGDEYERRRKALVDVAAEAGRRFNTMIDEFAYPELLLRQRLKARSPKLDLHIDFGATRSLPEGATIVEVYRRQAA